MNEYEEKAFNQGVEAATIFTKALNSMSYDKEAIKGFVEKITTSHRTLQQSAMRAIFALLMEWADSSHDERNEATVQFCQDVKKLAEEKNISFPFI